MQKHIKIKLYFFLLILGNVLSYNLAHTQTVNTKFGKNRVQYNAVFDDWWMYENEHYVIYWYGKERNLAKTTILLSQISFDDIEEILDFKINKKVKLIVYSNISDFKQSNLGIKKEENKFNAPGSTKFYGNKAIVYFNGNHNDLLKQIRKGTAKVFLKNMFSELSFENIYKKLVYSDFPDWFTKGLIEFLTDKWNIDDDEKLRNIILTFRQKKLRFEKLAKNAPELAGKSFFYFLNQKYSKNKLSDILYLIRISRNPESSFLSVTNKSLNELFEEWKSFFISYYQPFIVHSNNIHNISPLYTMDSKFPLTSISLSNDSRYITYAINNNNKIDLYLIDIYSNEKSEILNLGYINEFQEPDYNYPICRFDQNNEFLYVIYEKKGYLYLRRINLFNYQINEKKISPEYNRIYGFDILDDQNFIFNANVDGYSDLYMYKIKSRQSKRLTHDFWDNLDIKVVDIDKNKGILFASNRINTTNSIQYLDTIAPIGNFDIFFLNLISNKIERITDTPDINERKPAIIGKKLFYISDETGIKNIKIQYLEDTLSSFISDVQGGIYNFTVNSNSFLYTHVKMCDYKLEIYENNKDQLNGQSIPTNLKIKNINNIPEKHSKNSIIEINEMEIDSGLMFQSHFMDKSNIFTEILNSAINDRQASLKGPKPKFKKFNSSRAVATRLRFSFSDLITKVDNEPLFEGMEVYTGEQNPQFDQPTGFLVKSRVKDMFEDYFLEAGIRLSSDFRTKEYFSVFENLKHRLDWQYTYYRKTDTKYKFDRSNFIDKTKLLINMGQVRTKYPFDIFSSISLTGQLRTDRNILLASDTFSLNLPDITEQRLSLQLEYIFDNTSKTGVNSFIGNRSKFFLRAYNKMNIKFNKPVSFDLSKKLMFVLGFDIRQYFSILKKGTLALRMVSQTSFGSERNLYFLGGMENWIFAHSDNLIPVPQNDKYAYKILVANMRGFGYNARNGTSYILSNSELRIPVFQYLLNKKIKRAFFRDFQVTMFFDIGMAWRGLSPFSESNPANTKTIDIPPSIKIKLRYYADPIVAGYGIGVRTTLLGYFLKLDYAWGIETRTIQKPVIYFTMGYDF